MRRVPLLLSVVFLLLALAAPCARAEASDRVDLPRAGLSVEIPPGWVVDLYGDALLEARMGESVLWIRTYDARGSRDAGRHWEEQDDGSARCTALVERDGRVVFEVEVVLPPFDSGLRDVVDGILDTIDVRPYAYPARHVDARDGWTLTVPEGWSRVVGKERVARFEAPGGACRLEVRRLEDLMRAAGGRPDEARDLDAWTGFAWKEGLERLQAERGAAAAGEPVIEAVTRDGADARRVRLGLDPDESGAPRAWMQVLVQQGWRVLASGSGDDAAASAALDSFVTARRPGPRLALGVPEDRLPGEGGPPVVFSLPAGWTLTPSTNRMRRAQFRLPGLDAEGVVYYFGPGMGGGVDDNLERWRGQMRGEDEGRREVFEPAEGVKVTVLDVTGAYTSSTMNPHGANPHGDGGGAHGGFRMLAAVIEVPEGPLFVKLVGPDEDVARAADEVRTWLVSFRPAPSGGAPEAGR